MIEIKLSFGSMAAAMAFLASASGATAPPPEAPQPDAAAPKPETAKGTTKGKSASTAAPAAASPSADPSSAAAPATPPAASPAPAPASDEIPYAPLAQRITAAIAASNPNSAANRVELKALFARLGEAYGAPVKTGQDVKAADRGQLVAVLDKIDSAPEETMS